MCSSPKRDIFEELMSNQRVSKSSAGPVLSRVDKHFDEACIDRPPLVHKQQGLWRSNPVGKDYGSETRAQVLTRRWRDILNQHSECRRRQLSAARTDAIKEASDSFKILILQDIDQLNPMKITILKRSTSNLLTRMIYDNNASSFTRPDLTIPFGLDGCSARVHVLPQDLGQEALHLRQLSSLRRLMARPCNQRPGGVSCPSGAKEWFRAGKCMTGLFMTKGKLN